MSLGSVIGALRVVFGADTAAFEKGTDKASRQIKRTEKKFLKSAAKMTKAGKAMSIGITAPLLILAQRSLGAGVAHAEAVAKVEAGLVSMGGASRKTMAQLKKDALDFESASTFNADAILSDVTAQLITFGNVADEQFTRGQQAALDMSTRLKTDLKSSTILVGKALNDPIKGLSALSRVGITFTDTQKEMIKAMTKAGDVAGAQGIILTELEKQYGGSAKAARDAAPGSDLTDQWRKFQRILGTITMEVLPPLNKFLGRMIAKFTEASPRMQKMVIVAGAVLAAIGPVVTIIGSFVAILAPALAAVSVLTTAIGATAGVGLVGSLALLLGPLGLVIAAVGLAVAANKRWGSSVNLAQRAHKELYAEINKSKQLRDQDVAATKEATREHLKEAKAIGLKLRERIKEREELLKAQLARQARQNRGGGGGNNPSMGRQKTSQAVRDTNKALKEARDELSLNARHQAELNAKLINFDRHTREAEAAAKLYSESLNDNAVVVEKVEKKTKKGKVALTEYEKSLKAAKAQADRNRQTARDMVQGHEDVVTSIRREIIENAKLANALRVSQLEYDITEAQLRIMRGAFMGTSDEARVLAEKLVASRDNLGAVQEAANDTAREAKKLEDQFDKTGERGVEAFNGILGAVDNLARGLSSGNFLDILSGVLGLLDKIGGATGGFSIAGLSFGGARASGGDAMLGKSYLVGERGPELFTPGASGFVTPNHKLAADGMGAVTVVPSPYFDVVVGDISAKTAKPIATGTAIAGMGQASRMNNAKQNRKLA